MEAYDEQEPYWGYLKEKLIECIVDLSIAEQELEKAIEYVKQNKHKKK